MNFWKIFHHISAAFNLFVLIDFTTRDLYYANPEHRWWIVLATVVSANSVNHIIRKDWT